jgi:dolichyl-phosphate-mannose-protein mannosyltransferase
MLYKEFLEERPQLVKFLKWWKVNSVLVLTSIIMVLAFVTYFQIGRLDGADGKNSNPLAGYSNPNGLFWDENYHIASAERYLQGKYFMEPHPPLGKLIIALGEKAFNQNQNLDVSMLVGDNNQDEIPYMKSLNGEFKGDQKPNIKFKESCRIIDKDGNVKEPKIDYEPKDYCEVRDNAIPVFNYSGVRFFPVLFAWMCCILIFFLLLILTENQWIAFVFSLGFVFDNALIVHSRGAMLEGIQMFFMLSMVTLFVYNWKNNKFGVLNYLYLGILMGLAFATKMNSLIIFPLGFVIFAKEILYTAHSQNLRLSIETIKYFVGEFVKKIGIYAGVLCLIFCSVFWIHFSIANTYITTKNDKGEVVLKNNYPGYVSEATNRAIKEGTTGDLSNFVGQLRDHLNFANKFQTGVPKWDPTKGNGEAGSLPYTWPVGNRAIRYLAAKAGNCTKPYPDDCHFSYLYLIPNITVWIIALVGVLLALVKILSNLLFGAPVQNRRKFAFITIFAGLYCLYMYSIAGIERVMYLYHYFVPLSFGIILAALIFDYYFLNKTSQLSKYIKYGILAFLAIAIIVNFLIFMPFSYRFDMTVKEFEFRNWSKYWGLMMDY